MSTENLDTGQQVPVQPPTAPGMDDFVKSDRVPILYPHLFNESAWHWVQTNRNNNGFHSAFKKVGRTLYVNLQTLAECINATEGRRAARAVKEVANS